MRRPCARVDVLAGGWYSAPGARRWRRTPCGPTRTDNALSSSPPPPTERQAATDPAARTQRPETGSRASRRIAGPIRTGGGQRGHLFSSPGRRQARQGRGGYKLAAGRARRFPEFFKLEGQARRFPSLPGRTPAARRPARRRPPTQPAGGSFPSLSGSRRAPASRRRGGAPRARRPADSSQPAGRSGTPSLFRARPSGGVARARRPAAAPARAPAPRRRRARRSRRGPSRRPGRPGGYGWGGLGDACGRQARAAGGAGGVGGGRERAD